MNFNLAVRRLITIVNSAHAVNNRSYTPGAGPINKGHGYTVNPPKGPDSEKKLK